MQNEAPSQFLFEANGLRITVLHVDADLHDQHKGSTLHTHHYYEVFFVRDGAAALVTPTGSVSLPQGSVCVVAPDTFHYIYSTCLHRVFNLSFSCRQQDAHDQMLADITRRLRGQLGPFQVFTSPQALREPLERMATYTAGPHEARWQLIGACVYEFLYLLISSFPSEPVPARPVQESPEYRGYVIEDYINRHYHHDIALAHLAQLVHLSTHQLSRVIRKRYGQSFSKRVVYLRMKNAEKLIRETTLRIEQVATLVGYSSLRGFYTAFERQYHCPPAHYRNEKKWELSMH